MDTGGTARTSSEDVREHLGTARVAGLQEVWSFDDVISVAFPEADFEISLSGPAAGPRCDTEWQVTVREPLPGLNTWWGRWNRSFSRKQTDNRRQPACVAIGKAMSGDHLLSPAPTL